MYTLPGRLASVFYMQTSLKLAGNQPGSFLVAWIVCCEANRSTRSSGPLKSRGGAEKGLGGFNGKAKSTQSCASSRMYSVCSKFQASAVTIHTMGYHALEERHRDRLFVVMNSDHAPDAGVGCLGKQTNVL